MLGLRMTRAPTLPYLLSATFATAFACAREASRPLGEKIGKPSRLDRQIGAISSRADAALTADRETRLER